MSASSPNSIEISSKYGSYHVAFSKINELNHVEDSIVIADANPLIMSKIGDLGFERIVRINAVEEEKDGATGLRILEELAEFGATRNTNVLAFGGGVVQDLATLASSLYMRGLKWTFIPTTLMSMMDSCIGGKSSINLGNFKNLIGNFYPPTSILIDLDFAKTLNLVDVSSGIAEGMKICYAKGMTEFGEFKTQVMNWRESGDFKFLQEATTVSLQSKKWFIEIDEFDQSERKLLNFGHSFGHALEAATGFQIPHGIGVLLGMKAAVIESNYLDCCTNLLKLIDMELDFSGFKKIRFKFDQSIFKSAISKDKKNSKTHQVLILPNSSGVLELVSRPLNSQSIDSCFASMYTSLIESGMNFEIL